MARIYYDLKLTGPWYFALSILLYLASSGHALAQSPDAKPLKVVELYTSHGCSSCPPAERLLSKLMEEQDDIIALEFHVDYWDTLVHGSDGSFADPFSNAAYSARQRNYNAGALKGRPGVYTPQMIVNGRVAEVGSNETQVVKALGYTEQQQLDIAVEPDNAGSLRVTIQGSEDNVRQLTGTSVVLAQFLDQQVTEITGGENRHKSLTNHNVVTSLTTIGQISDSAVATFTVARPSAQEGCVVMVQGDALTPIHAAAYCP